MTLVRSALRILLLAVCVVLAACGERPRKQNAIEGVPERGRHLLRQYGCGTCHRIPGVANAVGSVGPPLAGIARRVYLGGVLPNTPQNMVRWIRAPQEVDALTAMPDMQVTEAYARDMVAYLYTLD